MVSSNSIQEKQSIDQSQIHKNFKRAKNSLFAIAMIGQWIFVTYILLFYGEIAMSGDYERVNEQLPHGIIEGDTIGNLMMGMHLALAVIIMFGGPLQFIPAIRKQFPRIHRWNGRIYYFTALITVCAGMYMNLSRGTHGGTLGLLGNTLNASLIFWFSIMAWRTAMQKDFRSHRKWAIRAFLMVSGVWFFRIGYGLCLLLSGFTGVGMTRNMTGPVDVFLMFGHSLVPLILGELYFWTKTHPNLKIKKAGMIGLIVLSIFLVAGISMVTMIFWLPKIV
jgi:hypothetical protein